MEATFKKIISEATDIIMSEIGVDSLSREDIEQKVIGIIEESGTLDVNEIVEAFQDDSSSVIVHLE